MIGPSYPFKGGIAAYTTQFYRELVKNHQVLFCSFQRQYPALLYPGDSDKDPADSRLMDETVIPTIDSMNPISWRLTSQKIADFRPDILVVPWWVMFWAPVFICIIRGVKRRSKATRIVFVCHNVIAHEPSWASTLLTRLTLKYGDGFLVHSGLEKRDLMAMIGSANIAQAELPVEKFPDAGAVDSEQARQRLGISGNCLLFFGFVRPYKGLAVLLDAMPRILEKVPCQLVVAGEIWGDASILTRQIESLGIKDHVRIVGNYVQQADVADYFHASDLVILPYLSATGSGVVKLAYSYGRPVLVTNVGSLPAAVIPGRTGHIVEPGDRDALADAVIQHFDMKDTVDFTEAVEEYRQTFSWQQLMCQFDALIESIVPLADAGPD
jgi:glycosyltransferase involved in cell wall biosynthesis